MVTSVKVADVIMNLDLYPREKVSQQKVDEYVSLIGVLPPITINQDNVLIDGAHRLYAYKAAGREKIEVEVVQTSGDDDLFLKAVELNARHGYQMTQKEKKQHVVRLYMKLLQNPSDVSYDPSRLRSVFSIPDSTWSDWVKDKEALFEGQLLGRILDLWLSGCTQERIAKELGTTHKTVSTKLSEMQEVINVLVENPESEIGTKYQFLKDKMELLYQFDPLLYNVKFLTVNDDDNTHFGRFPSVYMENLLYYHTNMYDTVFDPFAGGGTTIDACKKWIRRYYCSDMNPVESRKHEITKWNILNGIPKDAPAKFDFVFLDPPYWRQAEGIYSKDKQDLGNMSLEEFYAAIEKIVKMVKTKMVEGSRITFVIQPSQYKNEFIYEDHTLVMHQIFVTSGFIEVMRYCLPYATQQYNAQQVIVAKEKKLQLNLIRDLIVYRRA
jgi:hypothetical protein